ncbi:MAG: sialidase family protein [bacterium]
MQLKWIKKVFSDGRHNAFTGLTLFKGHYLLAFRNAEKHGSESSKQVIMTSPDGEQWRVLQETVLSESIVAPHALPPGTPMDYRDSYFLNVGDELKLYSFFVPPMRRNEDERMAPPGTLLMTSRDGVNWSEPVMVCAGAILWKPIFWQGRFWCAGYRREPGVGYVIRMYESDDGKTWLQGSVIAGGSECMLTPAGANTLRAFVRTEKKPCHMEIWESQTPFTTWERLAVIPKIIQAPHLVTLNGNQYLFGRETPSYQDEAQAMKPPSSLRRCKIWKVVETVVGEVLELPSSGDTSYVGTAIRPDGLLLVSYYSQHEAKDPDPQHDDPNNKPSDIFVAAIQL